jgi:two-component system, chemotaxis family, protein-glutamate methylesterase/glutaminase
MARNRIRVLIVDDSPIDRELLIAIIAGEPDLEVAGQAADAYEARDKIRVLNPDVITLDIEMPGMDGIKFLRNVMRLRPMPVVMCSAATEAGAAVTLAALEIGAVDFVCKPGTTGRTLDEYRAEVIEKVRTAAYARVRSYVGDDRPAAGAPPATTSRATRTAAVAAPRAGYDASRVEPAAAAVTRERAVVVDLVAIGASTGGVSAIEELLKGLPEGFPPVVITQHIPAGFSRALAERLDNQLKLHVHEAADGMPIEVGHVYVAPGGRQFSIDRRGDAYFCCVERAPPVNFHRPSVEVLFNSVAQQAGPRALGVMLTGMGADGAQAMFAMRQAGSYNLVQDEATSVVWGMPGAAVRVGAANEVLPLERIASALCQLVDSTRGAARTRRAR